MLDSGAGADCIISISNVHDLFSRTLERLTVPYQLKAAVKSKLDTLEHYLQVEVQAATPR